MIRLLVSVLLLLLLNLGCAANEKQKIGLSEMLKQLPIKPTSVIFTDINKFQERYDSEKDSINSIRSNDILGKLFSNESLRNVKVNSYLIASSFTGEVNFLFDVSGEFEKELKNAGNFSVAFSEPYKIYKSTKNDLYLKVIDDNLLLVSNSHKLLSSKPRSFNEKEIRAIIEQVDTYSDYWMLSANANFVSEILNSLFTINSSNENLIKMSSALFGVKLSDGLNIKLDVSFSNYDDARYFADEINKVIEINKPGGSNFQLIRKQNIVTLKSILGLEEIKKLNEFLSYTNF